MLSRSPTSTRGKRRLPSILWTRSGIPSVPSFSTSKPDRKSSSRLMSLTFISRHVGAHVSYDDLKGFGRRFIDVVPSELTDQVIYQIGALQACARSVGAQVRYVKPHGALYNTIVHHETHAGAVVRALAELGDELPILVLPDSEIERQAAAAGIPTVREAFADRAYTPEGRLVSRREEGSVLHDPAEISARVVQMATQRTATAIDGSTISVDAESICVHGDTPGALEIARQVSAALSEAGVEQRSFLS